MCEMKPWCQIHKGNTTSNLNEILNGGHKKFSEHPPYPTNTEPTLICLNLLWPQKFQTSYVVCFSRKTSRGIVISMPLNLFCWHAVKLNWISAIVLKQRTCIFWSFIFFSFLSTVYTQFKWVVHGPFVYIYICMYITLCMLLYMWYVRHFCRIVLNKTFIHPSIF